LRIEEEKGAKGALFFFAIGHSSAFAKVQGAWYRSNHA
jgi:hypothetical protein